MGNKVVNINDPLIEACKRNDEKAQQQLYQKYAVAMFNTSKRILGNREDAQDAIQEAFIDAFRGIEKFKGKSTFGAWLKRIVINKSIDLLQKRKKLAYADLSQDIPVPEQELEEPFNPDEFNKALAALPEGSRTVFTLKAIEGYDHKEIAQYLQISVSTSKSQYSRAKQLLRVSLEKTLQS